MIMKFGLMMIPAKSADPNDFYLGELDRMPDCLMVYYSDSGTTENLAQGIARGLRNSSYRVDLFNIGRGKPPAVHQYDLLGIGSPVYFFTPVAEIRRFINRLPELDGIPAFTFLAYGTNPGSASDKLEKMLIAKKARYVGTIACQNANFVYGSSRSAGPLTRNHISGQELEQARLFGETMPERLQTVLRLIDTIQ